MTKTTIRLDSREAQKRQQYKTVTSTNNNNIDYSPYNDAVVRTQPTSITVQI